MLKLRHLIWTSSIVLFALISPQWHFPGINIQDCSQEVEYHILEYLNLLVNI